METNRLFALLDGLAVHAAMRREQAATGRLTAVLGHYLDEICGREVRLAGKFEQH